uniref:Sigma-like factor n=1 Tax=Histiona aroides TaxID=392300 RepID=M4QBX0_HISAR|nr:sigma-like factor [Histiona aroides]AGH24084.1 sigma-like factor [Histiona aroides]
METRTNSQPANVRVGTILHYFIYGLQKPLSSATKQDAQRDLKKKYLDKVRESSETIHNINTQIKKQLDKQTQIDTLLRYEQYDLSKQKKQPQDMFEKDYFNSIDKERELFFEYEKSNISLYSIATQNPSSNHLLNPSTKDIKKMYKDDRVVKKYFLDVKNLEKIFFVSNYLRIHDTRIQQVVKNSSINRLNRLAQKMVVTNTSADKAPPNILKEVIKIKDTMQHLNNLITNDHARSIYLRKFYSDLKWNYIFLNRICRESAVLKKRLLEETYNKYTRLDVMYIDNIIHARTGVEVLYRNILCKILTSSVYSDPCREYEWHSMLQNDTHVCNIYKEAYAFACLMVIQDNIKEGLRNRIVNNYMPYITMMSKQYLKSGYVADLSNLIQEGTMGIIEAIDRYQLGRGVRFLTYAYWWMHRYMIKVTIKKIKIIKLDTKTKTQKKLATHIGKLYNSLKRKKKTRPKYSTNKVTIKKTDPYVNKLVSFYKNIKTLTGLKEFILCCLYIGIPPYRKHSVDEIAEIFATTHSIVLIHINKIKKVLYKMHKTAR